MTEKGRHLDLPRGFHDIDPDFMTTYRSLQEEWFATCRLAGYQAAQAPPVGFTQTFTAGHHATGGKLYRFSDRRGRDLALVSDSLPALLRLARARKLPEQRLAYCCPVFRYERRPRRHFHHLGLMEVLDRPNSLAEQQRSTARLVETIVRFLAPRLPVAFTVTDPGLWHAIASRLLPLEETTDFVHALRRLPPDQRRERLHARDAPSALIDLTELLGGGPEALSRTALDALPPPFGERIKACEELASLLRRHGAEVTIDLEELHASEFHDGPSFLLRPQGQQRLLGDGGSYGLFAKAFLGAPIAVHSAVIGLERLAELVAANEDPHPAADLAVLAQPQPAAVAHADQLGTSLRSAGLAVWDIVLTRPLRQHLRDLADLAIPKSVLIGERELDANHYTVRNRDGGLHIVSQLQLVRWLIDNRPTSRVSTADHGRKATPTFEKSSQ